jgi:hypothetical protein
MIGYLIGAVLGTALYMACSTRKLTGVGGLFGSRFWTLTIPLAFLLWNCWPVYGPGAALLVLFLSFFWACAHYYGYPNRRWDGSCYRRWYY